CFLSSFSSTARCRAARWNQTSNINSNQLKEDSSMPLTQLDPKSALIVIDLQKGIVALPTAHPSAEITAKSSALARPFRANGLPVILVNVAGGAPGRADVTHTFNPPVDWTELISELERQPGDHVVTKHRWGAFHETPLHHYLQAQGVT